MLPIYIFAAILGGGLLLIGMLGGEGDDAFDGEDFDVDTDLGGKDVGWKKALSFRTLAYALAAFGITGCALTAIAARPDVSLGLSLLMALFGGGLAAVVFGWVKRNEGGFGESSDSYIGGIGKTEVRIPSGGRGRIHLVHRGRAFTLPAVSRDGEIARREPVVVIDVVEGVAVVERAPEELTY